MEAVATIFKKGIKTGVISLALLTFCNNAVGQKLEVGSTIQQTVMGLQTGHTLTYRMQNGIGLGVFHQSSDYLSFEKSANNYPFHGLEVSIPVKACNGISLMGNLRTGLVNERFVIVTPELETRISAGKFVQIGLGAGLRSRQAAVSAKLIFSTF